MPAVLGSTSFRLWWSGTHASIPAGWTRDTAHDEKYFQVGASGFTAQANGGAATHTHDLNHTHTGDPHQHTITGTLVAGSSINANAGADVDVANTTHNHPAASSGITTVTYVTANVTTAASASDPSYVDFILIKPDDANQIIPSNAIVFGDSADIPAGMTNCDGSNGTTSFADKFPRAPVPAGVAPIGDGGGTGGTATHSHTSAAHTHNSNDHSHSSVVLNPPPAFRVTTCDDASADVIGRPSAHHQGSIDTANSGTTSSNSFTTGTTTNEPAWIKLFALQNKSGTSVEPRPGMILGWVEAAANLPAGWEAVSAAYDRQVKITVNAADLLTTGGSNTHVHSQSHGHTHSAGHTGAANVSYTGGTLNLTGGGTPVFGTGGDAHTWTVSSVLPTLQNNTDNVSSVDGRMPFRTLLLVKYKGKWDVELTGNTVLKGNTVLQ